MCQWPTRCRRSPPRMTNAAAEALGPSFAPNRHRGFHRVRVSDRRLNAMRPSLNVVLVALVCSGCSAGNIGSGASQLSSGDGSPSPPNGPDASTDDGAGPVVAEASAPSDASDAGPFCATPLAADAGLATLDDLPLATWCASVPAMVREWVSPCGGYIGVSRATGIDCWDEYVFDAVSRHLVASVAGCNDIATCVAGDPSFQPPMDPEAGGWPDSDCLVARVNFDLCAEAGFPPLPTGTGAPCTAASDCPSGFSCIYQSVFTGPCNPEPGCGTFLGACLTPQELSNMYPGCTPLDACACNGTTVHGCVDSQGHGYFPGLVALPVPESNCGGALGTIPLDAGIAACGADM